MRKTYWKKGSDTQGDGFQNNFTSFWKKLYYVDNDEPVTDEKIEISYQEYENL